MASARSSRCGPTPALPRRMSAARRRRAAPRGTRCASSRRARRVRRGRGRAPAPRCARTPRRALLGDAARPLARDAAMTRERRDERTSVSHSAQIARRRPARLERSLSRLHRLACTPRDPPSTAATCRATMRSSRRRRSRARAHRERHLPGMKHHDRRAHRVRGERGRALVVDAHEPRARLESRPTARAISPSSTHASPARWPAPRRSRTSSAELRRAKALRRGERRRAPRAGSSCPARCRPRRR